MDACGLIINTLINKNKENSSLDTQTSFEYVSKSFLTMQLPDINQVLKWPNSYNYLNKNASLNAESLGAVLSRTRKSASLVFFFQESTKSSGKRLPKRADNNIKKKEEELLKSENI